MPANPFRLVLHSLRQRLGLDVAGAPPDALLLDRFMRAGDESAFAALVERHGAMVWGVCRRVTGDAHVAEDAFQATWIVLSRKGRSVKDGGSLPGWLYRVAYRLSLAARVKPAAPLEDTPVDAPGPADEAALREVRRVIDEEVSRLPEKYRLPVVLCFLEGRTHAEAAAELGWPLGTVAGRVARAKEILHARLTRRGLAPSALPLPLAAAGAFPPVAGKAAGAGAVSLAAALLAGEVRRRWLVGAAVLLLSSVGVAAGVTAYRASHSHAPLTAVGDEFVRNSPLRPVDHGKPSPAPGDNARAVEPQAKEVLTLKSLTHWVNSVAISGDGNRIVSAGGGFTIPESEVKVWDAGTGQVTLTFKLHLAPVLGVAFSSDGKRIVSGGSDRTVRVWDAGTGRVELALDGHTGAVRGVAFSPDGKRIVSGGGGFDPKTQQEWGEVKVWDAGTGRLAFDLKGHTEPVSSVAFSRDGKRVVSGSRDRAVKVWDADTGQEICTLKGHTFAVSSVAFSGDGKRIVSGSMDGTVRVWDADTGQEKRTLKGHTLPVSSVAFSSNGKRIVSGSYDKTVKLWDAERSQEVITLRGHAGEVTSVAFSGNGKRIVSGSSDRTVKVWDAGKGQK
jgi:RNA polymerase sigma factor (sigma-70 family)